VISFAKYKRLAFFAENKPNKPDISQYALFSAGKDNLLCIFAPAVLKQLNNYTMILL